jgi:rubrerythrin
LLSERLNELHADEQHHLSRLTARLLELGGTPERLDDVTLDPVSGSDWEIDARARENGEVAWYADALAGDIDPATRAVLEEILDSERHHARELRGKWMSA